MISTTLQIGNTNFIGIQEQIIPELTWNIGIHPNQCYRVPNTHNVIQRYVNGAMFNYTDFALIQSRFDQVSSDAITYPNWEYAPFLLLDEPFHPYIMASWTSGRYLNEWVLEGIYIFNGITVKLLKTWYIEKYGSWNQTWWDSLKASFHADNDLKQWSAEYAKGLYEAWHIHVKSLGKKSATLDGLIGLGETRDFNTAFETDYYPEPLRSYVMQNYDFIVYQRCPKTLSDISGEVNFISSFKSRYGYNGKLALVLASCWPGAESSTSCPFTWQLFDAEYITMSPYVDIILCWPYDIMNWSDMSKSTPAAPHLISLYKGNNIITCPTLQNGSSDNDVKILQSALISKGFNPGPIDGIFGPITEAAVKAFQTSVGILSDGIVGTQTWAALGVNCDTPCLPSQCDFTINQ